MLERLKKTEPQTPLWLWFWLPVVSFTGMYAMGAYDHGLWVDYMSGELSFLELSQAVLLLVALFIAVKIILARGIWPEPRFGLWVTMMAVGVFYTLGEEISWGQHMIGWMTPEWVGTYNDQNETNLHNMSGWLDQKPRILLELGVIAGGIVFPVWNHLHRGGARSRGLFNYWIWPTWVCFPVAIAAELTRLPQWLHDMGLTWQELSAVRHSEAQEFFFYLFVLIYALSLYRRLGNET